MKTDKFVSYFNLNLEIFNEDWLENKALRQKRQFQLPKCELSILWSIIQTASAVGVNISQLIRYSRALIFYHFLRKFRNYEYHYEFVDRSREYPFQRWRRACSKCRHYKLVPFPRIWYTKLDLSPGLYNHEQKDRCHMLRRLCMTFFCTWEHTNLRWLIYWQIRLC